MAKCCRLCNKNGGAVPPNLPPKSRVVVCPVSMKAGNGARSTSPNWESKLKNQILVIFWTHLICPTTRNKPSPFFFRDAKGGCFPKDFFCPQFLVPFSDDEEKIEHERVGCSYRAFGTTQAGSPIGAHFDNMHSNPLEVSKKFCNLCLRSSGTHFSKNSLVWVSTTYVRLLSNIDILFLPEQTSRKGVWVMSSKERLWCSRL